jgi:hypothetical protein
MPFGIGFKVLKLRFQTQCGGGCAKGCWCVWHFGCIQNTCEQMVNSFTYVRDKFGTF